MVCVYYLHNRREENRSTPFSTYRFSLTIRKWRGSIVPIDADNQLLLQAKGHIELIELAEVRNMGTIT